MDDALLCWGSVLTSAEVRRTPTVVAAEHQFAVAATSGFHTCAVTLAGATYCWGGNQYGQLGGAD